MKKFTIEVSHASPAQLATIALDLKIMSNGWAKHGPRIVINGQKLQAPSLRIPGTGRKHGPRNGKPQASSSKPPDTWDRPQAWAAERQAASVKLRPQLESRIKKC